jgi:hypothetical protein
MCRGPERREVSKLVIRIYAPGGALIESLALSGDGIQIIEGYEILVDGQPVVTARVACAPRTWRHSGHWHRR